MTEEKSNSPLGDLSPVDGGAAPHEGEPSGEFPVTDPPAEVPPVSLLASGSHDEGFVAPPSGPGGLEAQPAPVLGGPIATDSATFPVATDLDDPAAISGSASGMSFPALQFDAPPTPVPAPSNPAGPVEGPPLEEWDEEVIEEHRTSWSTLLLASYASATTLALGWMLLKERSRPRAEPVGPPPAIAQPEPARQASLSRKVEPPEPILGEHFARLGQPLRVGSLEVTPVEVRRDNVTLQRSDTFANPERREVGRRALILLLKLRNTSADAVFAPLDRAYVRERGKEIVDTFVETAGAERIYPYPLAVDSEWSIVGQDFSELRPGESRTVAIVSRPDAPTDDAGPFTWRVRLRTGIDRTDTIGVRWPDGPGPSKPR